jgi:hypothetical protein
VTNVDDTIFVGLWHEIVKVLHITATVKPGSISGGNKKTTVIIMKGYHRPKLLFTTRQWETGVGGDGGDDSGTYVTTVKLLVINGNDGSDKTGHGG